MSFSQTYEDALEKARNRPPRPRKAISRGKGFRSRAGSAGPKRTHLGCATAKTKKKTKKLTDGKLKKKVWTQFSLFIRTRRADKDGITTCVTCPVRKHWKEMQAGHFLRGRLNSNLFDERGTNEQCYACNVGRDGNVVEYYEWMLEHHGKAVIDEMRRKNNVTHKWEPGELQELLNRYTALNAANPLIKSEKEKADK